MSISEGDVGPNLDFYGQKNLVNNVVFNIRVKI